MTSDNPILATVTVIEPKHIWGERILEVLIQCSCGARGCIRGLLRDGPKCNRNKCPECGEDLTIVETIVRTESQAYIDRTKLRATWN